MSISADMTRLLQGDYSRAEAAQRALFEGCAPEERGLPQPLLLSCPLTPEQAAFPGYNLKEIHFDSEKNLINGLKGAFSVKNGGREAVPSVRANMGCGIVAALFGLEPRLFEDKMPWVQDRLTKEQLSKTEPDGLTVTPEFERALEHMRFAAVRLGESGVRVYPLDIQGAFDTAHIVFGDDIFYELYDDPPFVHHLLDLSAAAAIKAFRLCLEVIPGSERSVAHYNNLVIPRSKGGIKISEDTSTLVCAEHVAEFVAPYTHRILEAVGGGYIHWCGRSEPLCRAMLAEPLAWAINLGNPEKHDMDQLLADTAAAGKLYYGHVPKAEGEDVYGYFLRILGASGRRILPLFSCKTEEREAVCDAFDRAAAASAGKGECA